MALSASKTFAFATAVAATALGMNVSPANDFSLISQAQAEPVAAAAKLPSQLKLDECISKESMINGIFTEGQIPLVTVDAKKVAADGWSYERNVFTSSVDFKKGYHLYQNLSGQYCKAANLYSIKLLRGDKGMIDDGAYFQPVTNNSSGTTNNAINLAAAKDGQVPMLQASIKDPQSNQTVYVTVVGQVDRSNGTGRIIVGSASGKAMNSTMSINPTYSDQAKSTFKAWDRSVAQAASDGPVLTAALN